LGSKKCPFLLGFPNLPNLLKINREEKKDGKRGGQKCHSKCPSIRFVKKVGKVGKVEKT